METNPSRSKLTLASVVLVLGAVSFFGCTAAPQHAAAPQPEATPKQAPRPSHAAQRVRADIDVIHMALDSFALNNAGYYPNSLDKLVTPDMNGHRYLNQVAVPVDPWGRVYCYVVGPPPNVTTLGADGKPGGTGDDADIDYISIVNGR